MSEHLNLLRELARLLEHDLAPVLLCRPTKDGYCTAAYHGHCGRQAGKRPLVQGFPRYADTPPTMKALNLVTTRVWPVNVGIVTGNRIVAVEADSPEADEEVRGVAGCKLATPTRAPRPGRGAAWIFRAPPGVQMGNRAHLGKSGAIDVRGDAGLLVVPPSRHATGHHYEWSLAPSDQDLMAIPEPLFQLVWKSPRSPSRPGSHPGCRNPVALSPLVKTLIAARFQLAHLWHGEGKRGNDKSASGYDFSLALALLRCRVPSVEVAIAVAARPGAHRHDMAYATLTVAKAAAVLAKRRRS